MWQEHNESAQKWRTALYKSNNKNLLFSPLWSWCTHPNMNVRELCCCSDSEIKICHEHSQAFLSYVQISDTGNKDGSKFRKLLLLLLFPVKDWSLSEHWKSFSDVYSKSGHGQCLGCYQNNKRQMVWCRNYILYLDAQREVGTGCRLWRPRPCQLWKDWSEGAEQTAKPMMGRNSADLTCCFSHDSVPRTMPGSVESVRASRPPPFFFMLCHDVGHALHHIPWSQQESLSFVHYCFLICPAMLSSYLPMIRESSGCMHHRRQLSDWLLCRWDEEI